MRHFKEDCEEKEIEEIVDTEAGVDDELIGESEDTAEIIEDAEVKKAEETEIDKAPKETQADRDAEIDKELKDAQAARDAEIASRIVERSARRAMKLKRRKGLIIAAILLVAAGAAAAAFTLFSTNVYQNSGDFKSYADNQFRDDRQFDISGKVKKAYEYGTPISYATERDVVDNKPVKEYRDKQIDKIISDYKSAQKSAEKKRAEENKDNKKYKAPAEALIISSGTYESGNGAVSIAISAKESQEQKKEMIQTKSSVYTYLVSAKTGISIYPEQVFVPEYRDICAKYFTKYIKDEYDSDQLVKGWEDNVSADAVNYNKFIISDKFVTFFFDSGTILDKSEGTLAVKVSKHDIDGIMRDQIAERYIDPNRPMVALTYDDGPGDESETAILDCLEKNGAVATFFYTGNRASNRPDQIKRAKALGCELGNHSWNHPLLTSLSDAKLKEQITKTNKEIKKACGTEPTVFRPCYGATNSKINSMVKMPVIMWSIDTLDWKTMDAGKTFNCIKKKAKQGKLNGKIVLMHSIHKPTAEATKKIVPWLKENGYQMVTVSEIIKYQRDEEPKNGKIYY